MDNGKWILNDENSEYWNASDSFDSREEAVTKGKEVLKIYNASTLEQKKRISLSDIGFSQNTYDNIESFDVGQIQRATIAKNGERFVDMVAEEAYEEYGEFAEDYLSDVKKEHLDELGLLLHGWFEKHNYMPAFFMVENVSTIRLDKDEN